MSLRRRMRLQLDEIAHSDEALAAARAAETVAQKAFGAAAGRLTDRRVSAAKKLARAVSAELAPLKLEKAKFRIAVAPRTEPGPNGCDDVAFEVETNPGAGFGALDRIASGGEMARFILALKVSLAAEGSASTLIFDEVDRGVGGAVADAVGERLARLAKAEQVLVVTHSPQVAVAGCSAEEEDSSRVGSAEKAVEEDWEPIWIRPSRWPT